MNYILQEIMEVFLLTIAEWGLYGGGFTIPSQIGNTGRLLTTNGTSLGWATTAALPSVTVPEPTTTNKGKALVSTGTGIEFADFNSGVSTGFSVYFPTNGNTFKTVSQNSSVVFEQIKYNEGVGNYNLTTGAYTVPVSGYYNIFANLKKHTVIWQGNSHSMSGNKFINYGGYNASYTFLNMDFINQTNNAFDASTGTFTCQIKGKYKIRGTLIQRNITGRGILVIFKNGSQFTEFIEISSGQFDDLGRTIIMDLNVGDTIDLRQYDPSTDVSSCTFSGELLQEDNRYYVLQKSTNNGLTYTNLKNFKDSLNTTEYLDSNNLIRISTDVNNSTEIIRGYENSNFGAHLLNSGESTNPIPIYGFSVDLTSDNTGLAADATITGWNYTGANEFALPTANFNSTTGIYTIPITGYYDIKVNAKTANNVDGIYLSINDGNDDNITNVFRIKENGYVVNGSANIKLSVNDTIRLKVEAAGDVLSSDTHWSCMLLATDTLTNTRQMAVSPIVPLHQLSHDQFAEGVFSTITQQSGSTGNIYNIISSSGTDGNSYGELVNTVSSVTTYYLSQHLVDSVSSIKYNLGGTTYYNVPSSPHTNWNDAVDYIEIRLIDSNTLPSNTHNFYVSGSFTIDLSKIMDDYIGLWNIACEYDNELRLLLNNETLDFIGYSVSTAYSYRNININNKYINCVFNQVERTGGEDLSFRFYRVSSIPQQAITEPIIPSITLPTPNSVNSGKVLVSNGSGYALENSGARNQNYISINGLTSDMTLSSTQTTITTWDTNNLITSGDNFIYNNGLVTIKNIGKYRIKCILTFMIK